MAKPKKYRRFGELMREGIDRLAAGQPAKSRGQILMGLADDLNCSTDAIYVWQRGEHLPGDPEIVAGLARIFVKAWGADQSWIERFLAAGEYYGIQELTGQLFGQNDQTGDTPEPPLAPERPALARVNPLTGNGFIREFGMLREFVPVENLGVAPEVASLGENLDFVGIKWSSFFGFTVALVKADELSRDQIKGLSGEFFRFNDLLYKNPEGLRVSRIARWLAFTLSGVICFVFEGGCSDELVTFIGEQKQGSPAYDEGITSLRVAVQHCATSFSWSVDLRARRVYKHLGKQPERSNYHVRRTVAEVARLEDNLKTILQPGAGW